VKDLVLDASFALKWCFEDEAESTGIEIIAP
jgi:hypothetical protein